MKSLFAQLCTYWSSLSQSTFTGGLTPCQSCFLLSSILAWAFFTLWVTRDLVWENVFPSYLTKNSPFTLKKYAVHCVNPMFYVYAYSKEHSQNFMDLIFDLFRLLKSYLGKHLVIRTMTFVSSSFNKREINLGNPSFTRPLHNSRLWTPTPLAIHEIHQAQKDRNVEPEFWVQQHGSFLKSSHMWMYYTLLSTSALLEKKKFRSSALYARMEIEGHGDSLGVWFQISWLTNGNVFILFSKLSRCLLAVKLQAKFPLTSEEVGWRQWGSHSFRKLSKFVTNFKNLVWKVLLYVG